MFVYASGGSVSEPNWYQTNAEAVVLKGETAPSGTGENAPPRDGSVWSALLLDRCLFTTQLQAVGTKLHPNAALLMVRMHLHPAHRALVGMTQMLQLLKFGMAAPGLAFNHLHGSLNNNG